VTRDTCIRIVIPDESAKADEIRYPVVQFSVFLFFFPDT